jgi:hypothetical protein
MLITTIAAALLSATTAPQPAATPIASATPVTTAAATAAATMSRPDYNPRVCLVDDVTGSHIRRRECKSLSQWRAAGLDPLAKR